MKLFVAAEPEPGDTYATIPGELVRFPLSICESLQCDCDQTMYGLVSNQATPAVMVRNIDVDAATYTELLGDSLDRADHEMTAARLDEYAATHMETASFLPCDEALVLSHFPAVDPNGCTRPGVHPPG